MYAKMFNKEDTMENNVENLKDLLKFKEFINNIDYETIQELSKGKNLIIKKDKNNNFILYKEYLKRI